MAAKMMIQPTLFLPHGGGPCFFMDPTDPQSPHSDPMWQPMQDYLAGIVDSLPERPRAILLVSGHWEEAAFTVHVGERPNLLFDYYGFPDFTYKFKYSAPGDPALAQRIANMLTAAGHPCRLDDERGFDHGVFIPLMLAYPSHDIPVVCLSLHASLDPATGRLLFGVHPMRSRAWRPPRGSVCDDDERR